MMYWKIFCEENDFPGLWQRWFRNQCVAVGWSAARGYTLEGGAKKRGWAVARKALKRMKVGDFVLVQLKQNRAGRVGEVIRKEIGDDQWNPLVPRSRKNPNGQHGRRILVRWDLTIGPSDVDMVVQLPPTGRLPMRVIRPTICQIDSKIFWSAVEAMKDESNWVSLQGRYDYERSLSDYIATYPHRVKDDLMPYPDAKVRERVFADRSRSDVLLIDKRGTPVVIECKLGAPTLENIEQLRRYLKHLKKETEKTPRGILVHGGATSLRNDVQRRIAQDSQIKIIRYSLHVDFVSCT